jgi:L-asparagine transporter-like permease
MISIAGVIGAGLFVGSKNAIKEAGPAVPISYFLAGTLVVLVMRMLGEMATANPDTGSFSVYSDRALGPWAGFSVGWLYWWFWVLVIPVEATAAAAILTDLIGGAQWTWALAITLLLTITNLASVGNYGEFEFWFALIKVIAIVAFIGIGVAAIFGLIPDSQVSGVQQLWQPDGFTPNGFGAVIAGLLATSGAVALFVYLAIASSQLALGRGMRAEGERAPVRMWLFPYLTVVTIAGIVAVLVLMSFDPDQQQAILLSAISAVFILGAGVVVHRRRSHDRSPV